MISKPSVPHRFSIRRKVLLGFGLVFAMLGVIALISYRSTRGFIKTAEWVAHTHEVMEIAERAQRNLMGMESGRRGFLITGDDLFLQGYEEAQEQVITNFNALRTLTADTPRQTAKLELLKELLTRSISLQKAEIDARRTQGLRSGVALFASGESQRVLQEIEAVLTDFERDQRELVRERSALTNTIANGTMVAIFAGSALTFVALLVACFMILGDIGARRRAEEALASEHNLLSSIIDTMPDHVFVKDVKSRYILDNAAHRRYLGISDGQIIEGTTAADYFPREAVEQAEDDDQRIIETGKPIINREIPVIRDGAVAQWLETTKVPLRDTEGMIVGLVGISSDISERKLAEEKLRRFAAQLERSNTELQNFASVASHDLQEPLRKVQAFGDRLRAKCSDGLGEIGLDYLGRMQSAASRMQVLIHDLLKLSRVTTRAQPFEPCDLGKILQDVLSDLEVPIEKLGAQIDLHPLPTIDADPVQLWQLFQNLINNSLKFHRPGQPPKISVAGRTYEAREHFIAGVHAGDRVCEITFQDHGIGFEEKFAEQIFVVFQRLHSRDEYEGTGIGLAVCRKITDRHGGQIMAKGAPGVGATFVVTLPVKQPSLKANE